MLMDGKGKLFGKISIIDLLVVFLVIAGLAAAYYKFGGNEKAALLTAKTDKVETVFYLEDTPLWSVQNIKEGDIVKDRISGANMGKVRKVEIGEDIFYAPNDQGKMVKSAKEGYCSVKIYVVGDGTWTDTGVTFGSTEFQINKYLEFRFGKTALYLRIQDIKKVEG